MTDRDPDQPTPPPAEPPSPFDRDRPPAGTPASPFDTPGPQGSAKQPGTGVAKPLLIGCGCLVLLGLVAIGALIYFWGDFLAFGFEGSRPAVEMHLPEDLDDERRARLDRAYEGAVEAVRAGEADMVTVQGPLQRIQEIAGLPEGERLTVDEVDELTEQLERVAGLESPAEP